MRKFFQNLYFYLKQKNSYAKIDKNKVFYKRNYIGGGNYDQSAHTEDSEDKGTDLRRS